MTAIIFTGTDAIKSFIVHLYQSFTPLLIFKNPVLKCCFHGVLLLRCQHGFFLIEDTDFITILIDTLIIDAYIFQVQGIFQNLIGICSLSSIRCIGKRISRTVGILSSNPPLTIYLREFYLYFLLCKIPWRMKQFYHKILIIRRFNPCGSNAHLNLGCFQISRLNCIQCTDIRCKFRVTLCKGSRSV